jgi:DNA-binding CsgD family transcriptional regulator
VLLAERGDLPAARAAYAEAVEQYTGLRADWDLLRADARLRPYSIRRGRPRSRRPATGWEALTPTELKIAYLVAEGNSNAEVAARLFLSRRTAEIHVSRILTKLDARSRVEIARHATARPVPDRPPEAGASAG